MSLIDGSVTDGSIVAAVSAAAAYLVRILIGRELDRINATLASHAEAISALQQTLSRNESDVAALARSIDQMREEARRAHSERMEAFGRLQARVDGLFSSK